DLAPDFLNQLPDESAVISCGENETSGAGPRKFENFTDEITDSFDLFSDAGGDLRSIFGRAVLDVRHLGRHADDIQRILYVVQDGAGELADNCQSFALQDFPEVLDVELAEAIADFAQQRHGQCRGTLHQLQHLDARNSIDGGAAPGNGAG